MLRLVSSYYARLVVNRMQDSGLDVGATLAQLGLTREHIFNRPRLSYGVFNELVLTASRQLEQPDLGLYLAEYSSPSTLGYLGATALAQNTLFDGLRVLVEFSRLQAGSVSLVMERELDRLRIGYYTDTSLGDAMTMHHEVYAGTMQHIIESMTARRFNAGQIHFQFDAPDYVALYPNVFHSDVFFNHHQTEVVIPARLLGVASPFRDPELAASGWRICTEQLIANQDVFVETTQASVKALLMAMGSTQLSAKDIALRLNCSPRSLSRRLNEEGTSFRDLKSKVVMDRAKELLANPNLSVASVAILLGYKDEAAFYRAFKRECGWTPTVHRHRALNLSQ